VHQSDKRRAPGHLSRQGPPALRWALYEAVQTARRAGSPDHPYYVQTAERIGGNRACLALARKLSQAGFDGDLEAGTICPGGSRGSIDAPSTQVPA
jgi:transposase